MMRGARRGCLRLKVSFWFYISVSIFTWLSSLWHKLLAGFREACVTCLCGTSVAIEYGNTYWNRRRFQFVKSCFLWWTCCHPFYLWRINNIHTRLHGLQNIRNCSNYKACVEIHFFPKYFFTSIWFPMMFSCCLGSIAWDRRWRWQYFHDQLWSENISFSRYIVTNVDRYDFPCK